MRYQNPESGADINLGKLDEAQQALYDRARRMFRGNASWFAFEQVMFAYTSPLFRPSRNRADIIHDPLYKALKDMWLQLGINQGYVAPRTAEAKARPADTHRTSVIRDVASPGEPRPSRKRRR